MHPPVFSDLSFDDALAKATADEKILLVDASASWCQPCKHMDKTTWVDGGVITAVGARAIAIQFDVDEQKELAKKLSVRAMPTVIAFRGGKEIDRVVGMRGPAQIIAWLDALARGETSLDVARATLRDNPGDAKGRISFAQMLVEHGELDEATAEYEKLWKDLEAEPQLVMLKHAHVAPQMNKLMAGHPPAQKAFARIRDATPVGTRDWVMLNRVVGETERTLSWYESIRDRVQDDDEEVIALIEGGVIPLLMDADRWADAGRAYVRPMNVLESVIERQKQMADGVAKLPADQQKQVAAMIDKMNAHEVSILRRALAAAGREDDLRAVEEAAAKIDPSWVAPSAK